tara:strand:+ start:37349 stop:38563 length:1215 start_codon:yes stop_codon:yes gene_type:complete
MTTDQNSPDQKLPLVENGTTVQPHVAHKRRSRLRLVPLVMVSLFTGAVIGMYFQPPALKAFFGVTGLKPGGGTSTPIATAIQQVQTLQEVAVVSEGDIVALGRIMPRGDVISIAPPFGAGDARIASLDVAVGDIVRKGDTLAVLDNRAQLQSAVEAAQATVTIRQANLLQTQQSISASLAEAQAAVERSQATATEAQSELARITSLLERGVTTRAVFDQTLARATEAERDVTRNLATLSRYDPTLGTIQADIAVAQANLAAARIDVTRTTRNLSQASVVAPTDGTILKINSRVGERPATGGILDLGDTSQMVVEAEVYQTLIGRVSIGDPVVVSADALATPLSGTVHAIGLEIGRQSITSDDPAANTDARVVDVIIWLDATSTAQAAKFTNLETVVRIDAGKTP